MTLEVGAIASDFSLGELIGEVHTLSEALGRGPVVLVFFKTTCPTCDLAFAYINRLRDAYKDGDWELWAIAQDPVDKARDYAAGHGIYYPVLPDVDGYVVSKQYDPPATPTIFLIDPNGTVALESHGFDKVELNSLSQALAGRLGVEPVVVAESGDGRPDFKPG